MKLRTVAIIKRITIKTHELTKSSKTYWAIAKKMIIRTKKLYRLCRNLLLPVPLMFNNFVIYVVPCEMRL
jgi:hypothetical protein